MLIQFQTFKLIKLTTLADVATYAGKYTSFASPVTIGDTHQTIAGVDPTWVTSVLISQAQQSITLSLKVPSPLPSYPKAGSTHLELLLEYSAKVPKWSVRAGNLPWFKDADEITGVVGEFLQNKHGSERLFLKDSFPLKQLGVTIEEAPANSIYFTQASLGLLTYGLQSVALVCVPYDYTNANPPKRFEAVALARLTDRELDPTTDRHELPAVLVATLSPSEVEGSKAVSPWATVVQWRTHREQPDKDADNSSPSALNLHHFLERGWNRAARYATVGARLANGGRPWWPLPIFDVPNTKPQGKAKKPPAQDPRDFRPLLIFATPGPTADHTRLVGTVFRGPNGEGALEGVKTEFAWTSAETVPPLLLKDPDKKDPNPDGTPAMGIAVPGLKVGLVSECDLANVQGWNDDDDSNNKRSRLSRSVAARLAEFVHHRKDLRDPEHVADWRIRASDIAVGKEAWMRFGAIELQLLKPEDEDPDKLPSIACTLRGLWNSKRCDVYPEMHLQDLPCRMRLSGANDPLPEHLRATFDVLNRTEDELHRSTTPMIGATTGGEAPTLNGRLSIRVKASPGRDVLMQLQLKRTLGEDPETPKTLYIQARPFHFARLDPPEFDEEAGDDFAYWRNDDPEGPQWRIPDANVAFDLPAQSVAEEMERGNRFWSGDHSYINPHQPLNYRFSPPTRVIVKPSRVARRYNKFGNNLEAVLQGARVESFRTELLYPIRLAFEVDAQGKPEIDIAETATFLGRPAPNLPMRVKNETDLTQDDTASLLLDVLPDDLAGWMVKRVKGNRTIREDFESNYDELRWNHSANRAQFVSRIAQLHVHDPYRPAQQLFLSSQLTAALRQPEPLDDHGDQPVGSMPPPMNPLPLGLDLDEEQLSNGETRSFLRDGRRWGTVEEGALRAGALSTLEFSSELGAILRSPRAVEAFVETLSFSTLGASGTSAVGFDEGRTSFSVEISDGQVWRIRKTRLGRIGIAWNKAKHVIVYERTVLPSKQFQDQQTETNTLAWPILRKTEEYIEPIEAIRLFDNEPDARSNNVGFVQGLEFITPRIYVDGAWGRDCRKTKTDGKTDFVHGYEIPLWNPADTSGFYPRPQVALRMHAGAGGISRAWSETPEELYFYTNTEVGTGSDSDRWEPQPGVDAPAKGPARMPLFVNAKLGAGDILDARAMPAPRLGNGRRKRFDLPVRSDGRVDLQHTRGETPMLVAGMDVVALARTNEPQAKTPGPNPNDPYGEEHLNTATALLDQSSQIGSIDDHVRDFLRQLPSLWLKYQFDCVRLNKHLTQAVDDFFTHLDKKLNDTFANIPNLNQGGPELLADLTQRLCDDVYRRALPPVDAVSTLSKTIAEFLARMERLSDQELKTARESLEREVKGLWDPLFAVIESAKDKTLNAIAGPVKAAEAQLQEVSSELDALQKALVSFVEEKVANKIHGHAVKIEEGALKLQTAVRKVKAPQFAEILNRLVTTAQNVQQTARAVVLVTDEGAIEALRDKLKAGVASVAAALKNILTALNETLTHFTEEFFTRLNEYAEVITAQTRLQSLIMTHANWAEDTIVQTRNDLLIYLRKEADGITLSLQGIYTTWREALDRELKTVLIKFSTELISIGTPLIELLLSAHQAVKAVEKSLGKRLEEAKARLLEVIGDLDEQCQALADVKKQMEAELKQIGRQVEEEVTGAALAIIDSTVGDHLASLEEAKETLGTGIKLTKAIGSLPELAEMSFNALRVEYLFVDPKKEIASSPFAARLREIDTGLKQLGLAVPVRSFLDQMIPHDLKGVDFNKLIRDFAGIDFRKLFKKFALPKNILPEEVTMTHGVDAPTRTVWAKATVNADFPEKHALFDFSVLAVNMSKMVLRAESSMRVGFDGSRAVTTTGNLRSTWQLDFKGAPLVTFRDVTVTLDGGDFHVNVAPNNIELHPALKFVSDIAKKIGDNIPPCIEVVRDTRGAIVGARANLTTIVKNPPQIPPVLIGPLTIIAGLGIALDKGAGFVVAANVSVGTKTAPIFVQIGWLGGGLWLDSEARFVDGKVQFSANVGLALGTMQAFDVGGVARGQYALLLYAYAAFQSKSGGSFRAGLSIQGSARILGIVNAYLLIVLEMIHESGKSQGKGLLDVEIDISRFYSIKVHKQVERSL